MPPSPAARFVSTCSLTGATPDHRRSSYRGAAHSSMSTGHSTQIPHLERGMRPVGELDKARRRASKESERPRPCTDPCSADGDMSCLCRSSCGLGKHSADVVSSTHTGRRVQDSGERDAWRRDCTGGARRRSPARRWSTIDPGPRTYLQRNRMPGGRRQRDGESDGDRCTACCDKARRLAAPLVTTVSMPTICGQVVHSSDKPAQVAARRLPGDVGLAAAVPIPAATARPRGMRGRERTMRVYRPGDAHRCRTHLGTTRSNRHTAAVIPEGQRYTALRHGGAVTAKESDASCGTKSTAASLMTPRTLAWSVRYTLLWTNNAVHCMFR